MVRQRCRTERRHRGTATSISSNERPKECRLNCQPRMGAQVHPSISYQHIDLGTVIISRPYRSMGQVLRGCSSGTLKYSAKGSRPIASIELSAGWYARTKSYWMVDAKFWRSIFQARYLVWKQVSGMSFRQML